MAQPRSGSFLVDAATGVGKGPRRTRILDPGQKWKPGREDRVRSHLGSILADASPRSGCVETGSQSSPLVSSL